MATRKRSEGQMMTHLNRPIVVVILITVMGFMTVGLGVWGEIRSREDAARDRRITQCQADLNAAFIEAQRERSSLAEADRDALERLMRSWSSSSNRDQARAALAQWLQEREQIDAARRDVPLPDPERARCDQR
jgi:hypothetical protein